jgi:hypothetical protein
MYTIRNNVANTAVFGNLSLPGNATQSIEDDRLEQLGKDTLLQLNNAAAIGRLTVTYTPDSPLLFPTQPASWSPGISTPWAQTLMQAGDAATARAWIGVPTSSQPATPTSLGVVIVPTAGGLAVDVNGNLSVNAGSGMSVSGNQLNWVGPMTAAGDLIVGGTNGVPTRLPLGTSGYFLNAGPSGISWQPIVEAGGTVTSVALTLPNIFTLSGSPITTSGTFNVGLTSQTQASFFAAPTGANGVPTFRTIAQSDLPYGIVYNPMMAPGDLIIGGTAGAASRLAGGSVNSVLTYTGTGIQWLAPATNGTVTSVGISGPNLFTYSSPVTSAGTLAFTLQNQAQNSVFMGPASGGPGTPTFRTLQAVDLPTGTVINPMTTVGDLIIGSTSGIPIRLAATTNGYGLTLVGGSPSWQAIPQGTVTSVGIGGPNIFTYSAAVTTAGALTLTLAVQSAHSFWAGPISGSGAPAFRSIDTTDLPASVVLNPMTTAGDLIIGGGSGAPTRLAGAASTGYILTYSASGPVWQAAPSTGVTSVGITGPGIFTYGSPVTSSGNLTLSLVNQTQATFWAGPAATTGAPAFRNILASDLPATVVINPMTTAGDLIIGGTVGAPARLAIGTLNQVLTVTSSGVGWQTPSAGGFTNPMTTANDIIIGGTNGVATRLPGGDDYTVLAVDGTGTMGWTAFTTLWPTYYANTHGQNVWNQNQFYTPNYINYSSSVTIQNAASSGGFQFITLTGNITFHAVNTNTVNSQSVNSIVYLRISQDGAGNRTASWSDDFTWIGGAAPTLSTAPNATDIITLQFDQNGNIYGSYQLNYH